MKKIFVIIIAVSLLNGASYQKAGTSSAQFLKLGKSARAAGLAESFTAVPGEIGHIWYNPAGVFSDEDLAINGMYSRFVQGINFFNLAVKFKAGNAGDLGLGASGMLYNQPLTTVNGIEIEESGERLSGSLLGVLNYSRMFAGSLTAGINIKTINDFLAENMHAFNLSGDLGLLYHFGRLNDKLEVLNIGLSVHNLGTVRQFKNGTIKQPVTVRGGVSYLWQLHEKHQLLFAGEVDKSRDRSVMAGLGLAWTVLNMITLRTGYRFGEGLYGFKGGLGFKRSCLSIDYAFDYSPLGIKNRFEIGYLLRFSRNGST